MNFLFNLVKVVGLGNVIVGAQHAAPLRGACDLLGTNRNNY